MIAVVPERLSYHAAGQMAAGLAGCVHFRCSPAWLLAGDHRILPSAAKGQTGHG